MKKLCSAVQKIVILTMLAALLASNGLTAFAQGTLTEDIKSDSCEFATNTRTVADCSHAREDSNSNFIIMDANDQYFEYTVNTASEAKYTISVCSGGKRAGVSLSISVNGDMVLRDAKFPIINNDYGWGEHWAWQELGAITLSPGKNVIRFTNESGKSTASVLMSYFKLDRYSNYDSAEGAKILPVNKNTVTGCDEVFSDAVCLRSAGQYFDYEIYTKKELKTDVSIVCGTVKDNARLGVSVNGVTQIRGTAFPKSGEYSIRVPHLLGSVNLKAGRNTLRFIMPTEGQPSADVIVANGIVLSEVFDIDDAVLSKEFPTNENTLDSERVKCSNIYPDVVTLSNNGTDYFEYDVYLHDEWRYDVSAFCGTEKGYGCMSVTVNGEQQIIDKTFPNPPNAYNIREEQPLGSLNLKAGKNTLRFTGSANAEGPMVVKSFKLAKSDKADAVLSPNSQTRLEVENYTDLNIKDKTEASAGKWVANDWSKSFSPIYMCIDARENGFYDLDYTSIAYTSGVSRLDVYLDGVKIGDNCGKNFASLDEEYGKPFEPYTQFNKYTQKRVYIEKGLHILKLDIAIAMNNVYKYMLDYIEFRPLDGYEIISFGASTDEGARHPYAVRKGYTGYAKAEIIKVGNSDENVALYLAEYDKDGRLVNVCQNIINIASMQIGEEKEFLFPLTYNHSGGTVKAFIMEDETLTPLKEASVYKQCEFFPNAQEIMNENTQYQLAKDVKDGSGNYYAGFDIHDDKYDIDAIFYDSEVGDQTKVFAYMGLPKGASEENPVPAVVCVHGGGGRAYKEWVKLWNDKGYAAIAMTMYAEGPVANETHPYAGTGPDCYGDCAFDKDTEKTTMIRNVLNVIRAHNVLRNNPCIDKTKIGITGISWGGITTTTTIGVDDRFIWAVPVYGTGYLDESETYFGDLFKKDNYAVEWDPANFAARSHIPTLYINGDVDHHFSLTATTKTCGVTEKGKMSIRHDYEHSHAAGWAPEEIYRFADSVTNSGVDPFITVSDTSLQNGILTAKLSYPENVTVSSVDTYYLTTAEHPYATYFVKSMGWKSISDYSLTADGISVTLPSDATHCYATITDSNGSLISTRYVKAKNQD